MNKKKKIIVATVIVSIIILLVAGATYAFIISMTNEGDVKTGSGLLDINYTAPDTSVFSGVVIKPSADRSGGLTTSAVASLDTTSVRSLFNMYITPTALTNLDISALKWEVEGILNGEVVYSDDGDFDGKSVDSRFTIVDSYELSTYATTFNIYIWLDESLIMNAIDNASFGIAIGADSTQITGDL